MKMSTPHTATDLRHDVDHGDEALADVVEPEEPIRVQQALRQSTF